MRELTFCKKSLFFWKICLKEPHEIIFRLILRYGVFIISRKKKKKGEMWHVRPLAPPSHFSQGGMFAQLGGGGKQFFIDELGRSSEKVGGHSLNTPFDSVWVAHSNALAAQDSCLLFHPPLPQRKDPFVARKAWTWVIKRGNYRGKSFQPTKFGRTVLVKRQHGQNGQHPRKMRVKIGHYLLAIFQNKFCRLDGIGSDWN